MNKVIHEILTTRHWMVQPDFLRQSRALLESNLNAHAAYDGERKSLGYFVNREAEIFKSEQISEDGEKKDGYWTGSYPEEPFVNVLSVEGPITRNGGACSIGSREHRDMMFKAADVENCVAHVFYIDTPGGSSWAANDYKQAIDYVHQRGQKVLAFIDGNCCSAGMYLAALCDEVYYMHPKNIFGCIGVMAAFYAHKPGEKDYNNESYFEFYDPESFDKNREMREAVNENDSKLIMKELAELGVEFRNDVKKSFPNAGEEHLHGKTFNAVSVKGILNDGQLTFSEVIERAFALHDGSAEPIVREIEENHKSNSHKQINMKNYETIAEACGVESISVDDQGAIALSCSRCDVLAEKIKGDAALLEKANAEIESLKEALSAASVEQQKAVEEAKEEALLEAENKESEKMKTILDEHKSAMEAKDKALEDLKASMVSEVAQKDEKIKSLEDEMTIMRQTAADKDEQIKQLISQAEESGEGSSSSNGSGAEEEETDYDFPEYDATKSPLENKRIREEYMNKAI